jgi:hypothetical protein
VLGPEDSGTASTPVVWEAALFERLDPAARGKLVRGEWVTLRGFTVEAGLGNGIGLSGGRRNTIVARQVRNLRQIGIRVRGGHWQRLLLGEVDITRAPYTTRYPELLGFMNPQPGQARTNRARNNVLFRCGEVSSGNWKYAADEVWATDANPGFVEASRGDFRRRPDVEVFKPLPGFQPIPFEKIGRLDRRAD